VMTAPVGLVASVWMFGCGWIVGAVVSRADGVAVGVGGEVVAVVVIVVVVVTVVVVVGGGVPVPRSPVPR
jgi:hypothetical protein